MSAQSLENPNDFPVEAFKALLSVTPDQRQMIHLYMECSDEVQSVVRSMYAVLVNPDVSLNDKQRAINTIADALYPNPTEGHGDYGLDLEKVERDTATKHPDVSFRPQIERRLAQLDTQESSFADRLRELLDQRKMTQKELAERIGCTQPAISKMLTRNCRPQKKTIISLAEAFNVQPTDLWPDLEVAAILDSIASFPEERELTEAQAASLDAAAARSPVKIEARDLPSRKRK